jgi:nucleotide-binding universal stress UspA family protein
MSYRTIFSIVNEHTVSTVIARYAVSMAVACKARLVLYAAHDAGTDEVILKHTARHQDHLYTFASELGIPVTRITEVGTIGTMLPEKVQAEKADLVFYPLTPYKRYGSDQQRHIVHSLLRTITTDLAIMRIIALAKPHPGHILVPLGTTISGMERRLVFISELARSFQSRVTLFHLFAERDGRTMPAGITQFRTQLQQQHVTVHERSGRGHIGRSITVEAVTRQNDLVVLGASGRGALQRLLFGNPAGDVMHHPPCNTVLFQAGR